VFDNEVYVRKPLPACSTLPDPSRQTAEHHADNIVEILRQYGKTVDNVEFMVSDKTLKNLRANCQQHKYV